MENLNDILEKELGTHVKMEELIGVSWLGNLFNVESELGNARFLVARNEHTKKVEKIYFIKCDNSNLKKVIVDAILLLMKENTHNVSVLDGKKIPLRTLSFFSRTYVTLCAGHMGNPVFETVEEVLATTQKDILSTQSQLGVKGLENLVEVINKVGYEVN